MQFCRPLGNGLWSNTTQRVWDAQGLKSLAAKHLGVSVGRVQEWVGADDNRRHSPVFQGHCVVHTARGAGASIGDAGDHKVTFCDKVINYIVGGWPGIHVLVDLNPVPEFKVLVHQLFDTLK